jgi:uncharacterized protein YidB (DUF937 family)
MGLFDDIGGALKSAAGQALGQAMGQIEANALPSLLAQLAGNSNLGSVGGLLTKLQEGGLGGQVASWLGNGSNISVSADQLRSALGNEQVQQMANSLGIPTDKILALLSQHLPDAVDKMSPNGVLEEPPAN